MSLTNQMGSARSSRISAACLPVTALIMALGLAGCQKTELEITDPWVRLSPVAGNPGAAYFIVKGGAQPDRLILVSSDQTLGTALHETLQVQGKMAMRPTANGVEIPAHTTVKFEPGGKHVMLYGLSPEVKAGQRLRLNFTFASGRKYTTLAPVRAAGTAN